MRRFGLELDDDLFADFYRTFPDHGMRTSVLRRCVRRMVQRAKATGGLRTVEIDELADGVHKDMEDAL